MFKSIHIFDDDKFIDNAIELFESVTPERSKYFVVSQKESFNHVTSKLAKPLNLLSPLDHSNILKLIKEEQINVVFIHVLNKIKQQLILELDPKITIVWFSWGYDLYQAWKPFKNNIYDVETKKQLSINQKMLNKYFDKLMLNSFVYGIIRKIDYNKISKSNKIGRKILKFHPKEFQDCFNKIKVVVPVVKTEMNFLKKLNKKLIFAPFSYGSLEQFLGSLIDKSSGGKLKENILVGNSANPTNNHVDVFIKLADIDLGNRKIIVPLNYSGERNYINFVLSKGKELLGENFHPILEFMKLDKYNELTASCGYVVFNHIRQQGMGNVIAMGFMGAKIFFNSRSPIYSFLNNLNFGSKTIDDLSYDELNRPLEGDMINTNKQMLIDNFSFEIVKNKVVKLNEIVNREVNVD